MPAYNIGDLSSVKIEQDLRGILDKFPDGSINSVSVANALSHVARLNRTGMGYSNEDFDVLTSARNVLALCGVEGYKAY